MSKREEAVKTKISAPLALLLYCAIGLILSVVLSFIAAILISGEKLPASSVDAVSSICVFAGVVTASTFSAKKFGRVILSALLQGLIFFTALYLLGAIFFGRFVPTEISLSLFLACLIGSVFGGILAASGKKRRH